MDKVHFPDINMFKFNVYASKNNLRRWRKGEREREINERETWGNVHTFKI